ncbi:hypothetical protein Tco_0966251 [Tanacetum coccineum]
MSWDRFNDLLRGCPHHGFSELHQLDTFYNALNSNDQDSLNSAAGGNFLDKMPRECLKITRAKSKVVESRSKAIVSKVSRSISEWKFHSILGRQFRYNFSPPSPPYEGSDFNLEKSRHELFDTSYKSELIESRLLSREDHSLLEAILNS